VRIRLRARMAARLAAAILALAAVLVVAGCGNRVDVRTLGETEGLYIDLDEMKYQVQISRYINPNDPEDRSYLAGLPEGTSAPAADETWFGVWIRVQNETDEPRPAANTFEIVDTQETVYRPIPLDPAANPFAYQAGEVPPGGLIPAPDSAAGTGPIQGALLLFKVKTDSLQNRPLEFRLSRGSGTVGIVDLDV
jgi:hypothetical protein